MTSTNIAAVIKDHYFSEINKFNPVPWHGIHFQIHPSFAAILMSTSDGCFIRFDDVHGDQLITLYGVKVVQSYKQSGVVLVINENV